MNRRDTKAAKSIIAGVRRKKSERLAIAIIAMTTLAIWPNTTHVRVPAVDQDNALELLDDAKYTIA